MVKIFVGNVKHGSSPGELRRLFEKFGKVTRCDILKNYGFVHMTNERDALDAVKHTHESKFNGNRMNVEFSRSDQGEGGGNANRQAKPPRNRRPRGKRIGGRGHSPLSTHRISPLLSRAISPSLSSPPLSSLHRASDSLPLPSLLGALDRERDLFDLERVRAAPLPMLPAALPPFPMMEGIGSRYPLPPVPRDEREVEYLREFYLRGLKALDSSLPPPPSFDDYSRGRDLLPRLGSSRAYDEPRSVLPPPMPPPPREYEREYRARSRSRDRTVRAERRDRDREGGRGAPPPPQMMRRVSRSRSRSPERSVRYRNVTPSPPPASNAGSRNHAIRSSQHSRPPPSRYQASPPPPMRRGPRSPSPPTNPRAGLRRTPPAQYRDVSPSPPRRIQRGSRR